MERNLKPIYRPERSVDLFLVDLQSILNPRSLLVEDVLRAILYSFLLEGADRSFLIVLPDHMFSWFNNSTISPDNLSALRLMVRPGYILSTHFLS